MKWKNKILAGVMTIGLVLSSFIPSVAKADLVVDPFVFVNNTPAIASQVNARYNVLYNLVNGNINNANIKAAAGIVFSKLDSATVLGVAEVQTITGAKTFSPATLKIAGAGAGVLTLAYANTAANRTFTFPDAGAAADFVMTEGAQTVNGAKTFTNLIATTAAITTLSTATNFTAGLSVAATQKLWLDGGGSGDTYLIESSANTIKAFAGGTERLQLDSTGAWFSSIPLIISATQKLYFDGGGDTYIHESAANRLAFVLGGTEDFHFEHDATSPFFWVKAGGKIYLDGGNDTYIVESAADTLDIVAGGTTVASFKETSAGNGEVLLDNVDPPTANYANRNGIVKGWLKYAAGIQDSYNISGVTNPATGHYVVSFTTDFSNDDYAISALGFHTNDIQCNYLNQAVGSVEIRTIDFAGTEANSQFMMIAIGDQ